MDEHGRRPEDNVGPHDQPKPYKDFVVWRAVPTKWSRLKDWFKYSILRHRRPEFPKGLWKEFRQYRVVQPPLEPLWPDTPAGPERFWWIPVILSLVPWSLLFFLLF